MDTIGPGIRRFTHGLIKKLVIADSVAVVADAAFAVPTGEVTFAVAIIGATAYAIQIYFDFSGYSDMAIGLGLMFGIKFDENFLRPYSSNSITEFWRRWHISLSSWFRDYLYIPLGGNRGAVANTYRNLMIVFLATGVWHGAAWTFVFWGLYHGLFLVAERLMWGKKASHQRGVISRYVYCLPVVLIGWIIFRADSLDQCVTFLSALTLPFASNSFTLPPTLQAGLSPQPVFMMVMGSTIFFASSRSSVGQIVQREPTNWRQTLAQIAYLGLGLVAAFVLSVSSSYSPFLYFRF